MILAKVGHTIYRNEQKAHGNQHIREQRGDPDWDKALRGACRSVKQDPAHPITLSP